MSSSVTPARKPLTSRAWRYFRIKDKNLKLAKCKLCQSILSYRTSVTNLLKHVRVSHKKALRPIQEDIPDQSDNGDDSISSLSENEIDYNDDDLEDNKGHKELDSIDNKNEEESVCLLCHQTFPDQDSGEMMEHMVKVHNISQIKLVNGDVHLEQEESTDIKLDKRKKSFCWDYYTVKDDTKTGVCNLCDREFSFRTTVSNLVKHLRLKHNIVPKPGQGSRVTSSGEKLIYKPRSAVWSFFNYVNDEKNVCACVHCDMHFNIVDGLDQMKRHLLDKHPEALLHHKYDDDPLFINMKKNDKNEESDDDDLAEEYLEFDDLDMTDKEKHVSFTGRPSFVRRSSIDRRPSFERRYSFERSSIRPETYRKPVLVQNNVPLAQATTPVPDTLEHFSKYITSLLQELPDKVSKKLQMNFITQIIEAQIEVENAKAENITSINSTVGDAEGISDVTEAVPPRGNGEMKPILANTGNSNGTITISNGIIIRPIVSKP